MYEEPTARILRFFKDLYPDGPFKSFYDGDPDVIPEVNYPALIVEKQGDVTESGPTGTDEVTEEILVKVVLDKRDDWGANDNADLTQRRIRQLVEARDDTGAYLPQSIKGALRTQLSMEGAAINNTMRFEIGSMPRQNDVISAEGHLTITVTYFVAVANRS
ncbi:hypothetical protein ACFWP5_08780 [Streptomyces sp. NPDC058469]|uniref:hypothetical protein n=1 Tax=Streptomyces sp. NPDC058469 TaxID=3346514 RepID=UPI00365FD9BB